MAAMDLDSRYIASELKRAELLAKGPPKPGKDETSKTYDTFRFGDFHDPETERWPYLSDPILKKIRKHGKFLLIFVIFGKTNSRNLIFFCRSTSNIFD